MKISGVLQVGGVSMLSPPQYPPLERQVGKRSGCCVSLAFGRPSPLPAAALSAGLPQRAPSSCLVGAFGFFGARARLGEQRCSWEMGRLCRDKKRQRGCEGEGTVVRES